MKIVILLFVISFVGCATPDSSTDTGSGERPRMAYKEIQRIIGLRLPSDDLGFAQKRYNPCEIGARTVRGKACGKEYLTIVGFRLQCRSSQGTVNVVNRLRNLPVDIIRWKILGLRGSAEIDDDGFGVIRARSKWSLKNQKVRIISGNDFLYMSLLDVGRVVVPSNWCR